MVFREREPGKLPPQDSRLQGTSIGASSKRDANQHLKAIRARKGLDTTANEAKDLVRDLENACKILSDQLYQKATHFLLELIQNADDNHYTVENPTLHLTYAKGTLRVDCNEVGFTPKDVEALCSIGNSSKAGAGVSTQYVGEKGIGFKSVFKVADEVWIYSQEYEFKFDRTEKLGMIAPIVEDFLAGKRTGWTSFYIKLRKDYNYRELIQDLESLDARLLIFLRRLLTIDITIVDDDGIKTEKKLTRTEGDIDGQEAVRLSQDDTHLSYVVMRHVAENLPQEKKRDGVKRSELLLAFPLDEGNEPIIAPQDVFAFLPIRDYGFKFLIQADFLLIASREDADNSSPWNRALRDEFSQAFAESVEWFNSSSLRYTWPRYLPTKPASYDFFSPLKRSIIDALARKPTLEAMDGSLKQASTLIYVPEKYLDGDAIPLTFTPHMETKYLAQKYFHTDVQYLKLLQVVEMDDSLFLDHLESIIKTDRRGFISRPAAWHSRLATVLASIWESNTERDMLRPVRRSLMSSRAATGLSHSGSFRSASKKPASSLLGRMRPRHQASSIFSESSRDSWAVEELDDDPEPEDGLKDRIRALPVVKLRTGEWVAANDGIFLPGDENWGEIPGGIEVLVVEAEAARDRARANLFRLLGVNENKVQHIINLIVELHRKDDFDARDVSRMDLISQLLFLFKWGWSNTKNKHSFWFATEHDGRGLGHTLYLEDEKEPHAASMYFAEQRRRFQFIHPDYLSAHPEDQVAWREWLERNWHLSNIPRLTRPIRMVEPDMWVFEMSPEFEFIIGSRNSIEALTLLCDHWSTYMVHIIPTGNVQNSQVAASYRSLKKRIASITVPCTDGTARSLESTSLDVGEVPLEANDCAWFLAVPDPKHQRWQNLIHFGVGIKQDVGFFLRCLEKFSESEKCDLAQATYFLEQIQARASEDIDKVRKFFAENKKRSLCYTPRSRNAEIEPNVGAWFPFGQVLWSGPRCLRVHVCANNVYPSCKRLLTEVIGVADATMRDLIMETMMFNRNDEIAYMSAVFLELEKFVEKDKTYTATLQSLVRSKVWPVTKSAEPDEFDEIMSGQAEWFIADTNPLRKAFGGIVPLLAFLPDSISQMERIIHSLEYDQRRLTRAAKSFPKVNGAETRSQNLTAIFQSKYEFISRLVKPSAVDPEHRKRTLRMLQNMEVYTATDIIQRWSVTINGREIEGRPSPGQVVLTPSENNLKIYLRQKYFERERNPTELVEKLKVVIGLKQEWKYLLHIILTESNVDRILSILEDHGVPMSYPEDDGNQDWLVSPMRRRPSLDLSGDFFGSEMETFTVISSQTIANMLGGVGAGSDAFGDDAGEGSSSTVNGTTGGSGDFGDFGEDSPFGAGFRIVGPRRGPHHHAINDRGIGDAVDDELAFAGELFVFTKFVELMDRLGGEERFDAETHWTSPLRERAGIEPFTGVPGSCSAFTIEDRNGQYIDLFAKSGIPEARSWRSRPPTWHIEVKSTRRGLNEEFSLTPAQFERARRFSIQAQEELYGIPTDVMLLVRVHDVDKQPKYTIFNDPWELFLCGNLQLKSNTPYIGKINA